MAYYFVLCDMCMVLACEVYFPNNTGMSQIICIYMLLIATSLFKQFLLLTMCFTLVKADISSDTTFTPIVIFGQISRGPMDLFFSCSPNASTQYG